MDYVKTRAKKYFVSILSIASLSILSACEESVASSKQCEEVSLYTRYDEVKWVNDEKVRSLGKPQKVETSLSKDGGLMVNLLVGSKIKLDAISVSKTGAKGEEVAQLGSYSVKPHSELQGMMEIEGLEVQKIFEELKLDEKLHFDFKSKDSASCRISFEYEDSHNH